MTTAADAQSKVRPSQFARSAIVAPLILYLLSRLFQLLLVGWMAPDGQIRSRLFAWDGGHFVRVAQEGYPDSYSYDPSGVMVGNGLAFFPGYPMLARTIHLVTRVDVEFALLAVSWIAGAVAAVLIYQLGARLYDARAGLALTVLFCAQPMSMTLSMAYSEALFTAFVAGMLLCAHRGAWLGAGALGLAAALTRPTGAAAAIALAVAAGMAMRDPAVPKWRPIVASLLALAGVPAYLAWVGFRIGDPDAWFRIQTAGWGTTFDYGASSLRFLRDAIRGGDGWIQVSVALLLIAAVVAAVVAVTRRVWPPLLVYGLIALVLVLGQAGYYHSKPRLLVPVLLVLVPAAAALARSSTRTMVLALTLYSAFGLWYGSYLITVWKYAI